MRRTSLRCGSSSERSTGAREPNRRLRPFGFAVSVGIAGFLTLYRLSPRTAMARVLRTAPHGNRTQIYTSPGGIVGIINHSHRIVPRRWYCHAVRTALINIAGWDEAGYRRGSIGPTPGVVGGKRSPGGADLRRRSRCRRHARGVIPRRMHRRRAACGGRMPARVIGPVSHIRQRDLIPPSCPSRRHSQPTSSACHARPR